MINSAAHRLINFTSYPRFSMESCIAAVALASLLCGASADQKKQPSVRQVVKTDLTVYAEGVAPTLPQAGIKMIDPVFGTQVMRVTDERDGASFGTAYSYWPSFNRNNTQLLAQAGDGTGLLISFDPTVFRIGAKEKLGSPPGVGYTTSEDAVWSGTDPQKLYVHRGAILYVYNVPLRRYTMVKDFTDNLPAGFYMMQMSMSRDDDVMACTLKDAAYNVQGYMAWRRSTNKVLYEARTTTLDEVQVDKSGRYLVVKTGEQGLGKIEVKIIDLQTQAVTDLTDNEPDYAPGHSDNGSGTIIGADNWKNRITYRTLAAPHDVRTVLAMEDQWDNAFHVSLPTDNESWALVSFFGEAKSGVLRRELVLVATDGSQHVRRLAHHYSIYRSYYDSPRANISRDGKFIAFTSNWGSSTRHDLFVAQVP